MAQRWVGPVALVLKMITQEDLDEDGLADACGIQHGEQVTAVGSKGHVPRMTRKARMIVVGGNGVPVSILHEALPQTSPDSACVLSRIKAQR
jgi:hypothetical protein